MRRRNRRSNEKEDVTQVKTPICNISIIINKNECRDPLLIKDKDDYKIKKRQHQQVHTILTPKTTPKLNSLSIYLD